MFRVGEGVYVCVIQAIINDMRDQPVSLPLFCIDSVPWVPVPEVLRAGDRQVAGAGRAH